MREEQASGLATSLDADFTRSLDFIKAGELCFTNGNNARFDARVGTSSRVRLDVDVRAFGAPVYMILAYAKDTIEDLPEGQRAELKALANVLKRGEG